MIENILFGYVLIILRVRVFGLISECLLYV